MKSASPYSEIVNLPELLAALARRGLRQNQLAKALDVSASTLHCYLHEKRRAPVDLVDCIERVLNLKPGTLACGDSRA